MTISKIEPSCHVKGRILLFFESGECWKATEQEVLAFSLYPGKTLSDEESRALERACGRSGAKARAAEMIGRQALSKKELQKRLVRKGSSEEDAAAAADWLEDIGALDDENYARVVARHYAAAGYGPAKVRDELYRRGVPRELWDAAIERYAAAKLRGKAADEAALGRVAAGLRRRGFRWEDIKPVLDRLRGEALWEE